METVVVIIMVLVGLSFLLRLTSLPLAFQIAMGVLLALVPILGYDLASEQSKTQIADWLNTPALMLDVSVWLTVDVALQVATCFLPANTRAGRVLKYFPGLLIFPAVFSLLTYLLFLLPGVEFSMLGYGLGVVLVITIPLLAWLIKYLLPENELRFELIFLINIIVATLGVVATVNGTTKAAGTNELNLIALWAFAALLFSGLVAGMIVFKILNKRQIKKLV